MLHIRPDFNEVRLQAAERLGFYYKKFDNEQRSLGLFFELYRRHQHGQTMTWEEAREYANFEQGRELNCCLRWAEDFGYLVPHNKNDISVKEILRPTEKLIEYVEQLLDAEVSEWKNILV